MTTRWPARFVAMIAAALAILITTASDADAARRAKRTIDAAIRAQLMPMTFFVATGEPDACGPGCKTWIAAEGDFDDGAAERFRGFLGRLGNRDLPVFFNSRGGLLGQALSMGESLYTRRMTASVGRSSPIDCRRKSKAACDKLKGSAAELRSRLQTNALCASACVYAIVGGVRRQVAANALLRVHAPSNFSKLTKTERTQVLAAVDHYMERAGVTPDLMKVTLSVPFERIRTLTRKEVVQFGIDRREPPALWEAIGSTQAGNFSSKSASRPEARLQFFRQAWSGAGVIDIELRLRCYNGSIEIVYNGRGRQEDDPSVSDVSLMIDSKTIKLAWSHNSGPQLEVRSAIIPGEIARALLKAQNIAISREANPQSKSEISRLGLDDAMRELVRSCPKPFTETHAVIPAR